MSNGEIITDRPIWRKIGGAAFRLVRRGGKALARTSNLGQKKLRRSRKQSARSAKIAREKVRNAGLRTRNVAILTGRRVLNLRKPLIRLWRRGTRLNDRLAARRIEWRVERELDHLVHGSEPIILGPWISEVGYEILYWVPFLRWLKNEYNLAPQRLIAVSRGGVASWYDGIAATYVEIFDHLDPGTFGLRNESRRLERDGSRKQLEYSDLDEEILTFVRKRLNVERARICHPSLMYRLFRQYWVGQRSLAHVQAFTRFTPRPAPNIADLNTLPDRYIAAKFYAAASLPDTSGTRAILNALVTRLADAIPVVLLDTGLAVDDHDDYLFAGNPRVFNARHLMTPRDNLGVQTQIIASASAFVGTCGSVTWLAPMLGVDTVAVLADEKFLHGHLYVARQAYRAMQAGRFMTMDVGALERLDLTFSTGLGAAETRALATPIGRIDTA